MKRLIVGLMAVVVLVGVGLPYADASITLVTDRPTFESAGAITYNYGFEDVPVPAGFFRPPDPWTTHGVTYNTSDNLVIDVALAFQPQRNVFLSNDWTPLTASIQDSPSFNMLGFDLGVFIGPFYSGGPDTIDITVYTNVGTYNYDDLTVPDIRAGAAMDFYGFIADSPTEYFTGLRLDGVTNFAPAIDNVTLGNIPEPTTFAIWSLLGAIGLAAGYRRRKRA